MGQEGLILRPIRRVSPSRYTAMKSCLLRETWTAASNEPLLPPSPVGELGSVIHELLAAAGRGEYGGGGNESIRQAWDDLVLHAEKTMLLSPLRRHQVPLSRSIADYEVRKLRACNRAAEVASVACRGSSGHMGPATGHCSFELWVESHDGLVGGYIDRVAVTADGVVLSDYKSGATTIPSSGGASSQLKRAYKEQMTLYAALYQMKWGVWPVRLAVVPLKGAAVDVCYNPDEALLLLADASAVLRDANRRIARIESGDGEITRIASPGAENCRYCLFRPACQAYWLAKRQWPRAKWPTDLKGVVKDVVRLRNGKVCLRIAQSESPTPSYVTVRNLTDGPDRHPFLHQVGPRTMAAFYSLEHNGRSGDFTENQYTVLYA